jgi:CRP-like cAMP-binding protein
VSTDPLGVDTQTMRRLGYRTVELLVDRPRTADVVAQTSARLYALGKHDFLAAVTGHPASARAAERIVHERLAATTR